MITVWYRHRGQLPSQTQTIRDDAQKAEPLPQPFEVVGVQYGRQIDTDTIDRSQFGVRVDPPADNISADAIDAVATAFGERWGGEIRHVETAVQPQPR